MKEFHMKYPGIRLKIYNHSTPQAIEAVKSGMIDFAVVSTPAAVDAPLKEIVLESFQEVLVGGRTFMVAWKSGDIAVGIKKLSADMSWA